MLGAALRASVSWGIAPGSMGKEDGARTTLACATSRDK